MFAISNALRLGRVAGARCGEGNPRRASKQLDHRHIVGIEWCSDPTMHPERGIKVHHAFNAAQLRNIDHGAKHTASGRIGQQHFGFPPYGRKNGALAMRRSKPAPHTEPHQRMRCAAEIRPIPAYANPAGAAARSCNARREHFEFESSR
jgi:hypothetical protein